MYAKLKLPILMGIESKYSYALYRHLQDYIGLKRFRCNPNDYRRLMGIKDGQYESFSMLTDRTIRAPVEEINEKTDMRVTYSIERIGRRPGSILFQMEPNKKNALLFPDNDEICDKLKAFGIQNHQIEKLFKLHTPQYLLANIAVVEGKLKDGSKIRSIPGYLMHAFKVDLTSKETEYEKLKQQKALEEKSALEKKEKEELELVILEGKFKQEKNARIKNLKASLSEEEFECLRTEFEGNIQERAFLAEAYQAKGFDHHFIQGTWNNFLAERFLPFEYQSFENYRAKQEEEVSGTA